MYHQNPRVRDAQNPYRTGVLIGNCWEDKFGMELATQPKIGTIGTTENKAKLSLASSTAVYENVPKTREMILAEREYADYDNSLVSKKRGLSNHLFIGHGSQQETFEKRDFATTNDMVYERRARVDEIINPNTFEGDMFKTRSKQFVNTQAADLPKMFGKSGTAAGETIPKHYNQFTRKFDNNCLNLGLRQ